MYKNIFKANGFKSKTWVYSSSKGREQRFSASVELGSVLLSKVTHSYVLHHRP